jgi:hypothetical protein
MATVRPEGWQPWRLGGRFSMEDGCSVFTVHCSVQREKTQNLVRTASLASLSSVVGQRREEGDIGGAPREFSVYF